MDVQVGERAGRVELQRTDLGLRRRRLHTGAAAEPQRGERCDPVIEGQLVDRPGHARRHRRIHCLQRQHQPLLCYQVFILSFIHFISQNTIYIKTT